MKNETETETTSISEKYRFAILKNYFKDHGIVRHQIDTFNDYLNNGISRVVKESDIIIASKEQKYTVSFGDVYIPNPSLIEEDRNVRYYFPQEARVRDLTYDSPIHVDVIEKLEVEGQEPEITHHRRVIVGRTPIMLGSDKCNLKPLTKRERIEKGECEWDSTGYFIIRGKERVLVGQLRGVYNQPIVLKQKASERFKFICETRSMSEETGHSVLIQIKISTDDRSIVFSLPNIKELIPVGIVFKALGFTDEEEIKNIIGLYDEKTSKYVKYILRDSYFIKTKEDALKYIGQYAMHTIKDDKKSDYALQIVENELLPHMGISSTIKEKAYFLGNMINKILRANVGMRNEDDRDNYANKRVEMAGVLCCDLFRALFKRFVKSIQVQLEKKKQHPDILSIIARTSSITLGLKHSFSTGSWGIQKNNYVRTGVSQVLSRMTHGSVISHLRRINIPIGKEGKNAKIRQIHSSQIMYICPSECFDPETPILTWNGIVKLAKDIVVGDILIDDKGNPTRVKSTISGDAPMYEVKIKKNNFLSHTVTSNHILTLKIKKHKKIYYNSRKNRKPYYEVIHLDKQKFKYIYKCFNKEKDAVEYRDSLKDDDIIDITISDYLKLSNTVKKNLSIFKVDNINWEKKDVSLDPYILGTWLGDGYSSGTNFVTEDVELLNYWKKWAQDNNGDVSLIPMKLTDFTKNYKEHQISKPEEYRPDICYSVSCLKKHLLKYDLIDNKHIPNEYLTNDRETRLKVLAGLIDTDGSVRANGHEIRICQGPKNTRIIHDALFLAQSLGFSCHLNTGKSQWTHTFEDGKTEKRFGTYEELSITGEFLYEIPILLPRKKLNDFSHNETARIRCSSFLQSPFELIEKGVSPFVGWQLEGNGRFLLSDLTVSHNTPEGQSIGIVLNLALLTTVTRRIPTVIVKEIVENSENLIFINNYEGKNDKAKVFLNGILMGFAIDPDDFLDEMKSYRSSELLHKDVSFTYDKLDNEVRIFCDEGRFTRPVFTVNDDNRLKITENDNPNWSELVDKEVIQYVDNSEVENSVIAMNDDDLRKFKCNYQEIHPSMMLGIMASSIPFPDHSQCIFKEEPVYMSDGSVKKIKDIKIGDMVISFNPETQAQSFVRVTHVETHPTEKPLFQITTVSGRKITATFDHRFMTSDGWKRLEHLETHKTLIGISLEQKPVSTQVDTYTVIQNTLLRKNNIVSICDVYSIHQHLPIIARLFGYTFFDEISINDEGEHCMIISFKEQYDLEMFENDLQLTEIICTKFKYSEKKIVIEGEFATFMKLLRDEQLRIPEWIINGSDMVKREFLASLDHDFMDVNNSKSNVLIDVTQLYKDLGIHYSIIDKNHHIKSANFFKLSYPECIYIKFCEIVGFRYNYKKHVEWGMKAEYLKYVLYNTNRDDAYIPVYFEHFTRKMKTSGTTVFMFIDSIAVSTENIISDITVDSENQSFLCGDTFCVHNSPRNLYQSSMGQC